MKAKQLPGSLDEWLKTRTVVIGAVNWLKAGENRRARRANDDEKTPKPSSMAKTLRIPTWIKLVPILNSSCDVQAAVRGQRVIDVERSSPPGRGRGSRQLSRIIRSHARAPCRCFRKRVEPPANAAWQTPERLANQVSVIAQYLLPG